MHRRIPVLNEGDQEERNPLGPKTRATTRGKRIQALTPKAKNTSQRRKNANHAACQRLVRCVQDESAEESIRKQGETIDVDAHGIFCALARGGVYAIIERTIRLHDQEDRRRRIAVWKFQGPFGIVVRKDRCGFGKVQRSFGRIVPRDMQQGVAAEVFHAHVESSACIASENPAVAVIVFGDASLACAQRKRHGVLERAACVVTEIAVMVGWRLGRTVLHIIVRKVLRWGWRMRAHR